MTPPTQPPRVSVMMPAYNAERFIGAAIDSVLAQTWQDWELIVVDDGSTDATPNILDGFSDPRIIRTRQSNQGEASARNTALALNRGEYLAFLDADDLYLPNALADMVQYLEAHPTVDALISDGYFCDAAGRPLMRLSEHRPGPYMGNICEPLVLSASVISGIICTMVRRAAVERADAHFDPTLIIGPDWDFWIQCARYAQFGYLDKLTCMYRISDANITKTTSERRRRADLVRGRRKVMNADWFAELSLPTRRTFFYNLLVGLLGHQPKQQRAIIEAAPFEALPPGVKSDLLRQVASSHLSGRQNAAFALDCLRRSVGLQPDSRKGRALLALAQRSPALAAAALAAWQVVHRTVVGVTSVGRRKPKPVPAALAPIAE